MELLAPFSIVSLVLLVLRNNLVLVIASFFALLTFDLYLFPLYWFSLVSYNLILRYTIVNSR